MKRDPKDENLDLMVTKIMNLNLNEHTAVERVQPTIFTNMPRPLHTGWSNQSFIGVPDGYCSINHCNTKWLLNVMKDSSDSRLQRMLKQRRTRIMFESDKYYQILDDPTQMGNANALHRPAFHSKAFLYMNAFGVAIYLHQFNALRQLAKQRKYSKPMIQAYQPNYASYVKSLSLGDVLIFNYDYLLLKREAYEAIPYLLAINWYPSDSTSIVYRRRFYQYVTPLFDWVDVCKNILRTMPTLQVSKVTQEMIQSRSPNFNILELREMGRVMLEYFELKKLTSENFNDPRNFGMYAGRKLLRDKEATLPLDYAKVFDSQPKRPVIPHSVSAARRFLSFSYYTDHENLSSVSQILSVTDVYLQHRFFSCLNHCSDAKWHRDPLLFQIYEFINLQFADGTINEETNQPNKILMREQAWSDIASDQKMFSWYHRFDILNCLSLLFGLLQNCCLKNFPPKIIDRICQTLLDIMVQSEFVEPFLSYSFYDTYFALTSLVNCVPGLQSSCVMRMMKKAPLLLTRNYSIPQISFMFSLNFWCRRDATAANRPNTLRTIGEFLVTRKRLMSMRTLYGDNGEGASCTSSMGHAGNIILFGREPDRMSEVSQAEEEVVDTSKTDTIKKAKDEAEHIRQYSEMEIDHRYSSAFGQYYRYAAKRPKIILDEAKSYPQNLKDSRDPPAKLPGH